MINIFFLKITLLPPTKHIFKDLEAFCLRHVVIVFKNVCIILL